MLTPARGDVVTQIVEASQQARYGAATVRAVRRLLIAALVSWILYSLLLTGSRGACTGGPESGDELCAAWSLRPSPFVGLGIALLVIWAVGRIARTPGTEADAVRLLERTGGIVIVVAACSALIATVWFWSLPGPGTTDTVYFPFPFAVVTVQ